MSKPISSIAFSYDITSVAFSNDHSQFAVCQGNEIVIFGNSYPECHHSVDEKVTALWWDRDSKIHYRTGSSDEHELDISHNRTSRKHQGFKEPSNVLTIVESSETFVVRGIFFRNLYLSSAVNCPTETLIRTVPYDDIIAIIDNMSIRDAEYAVEALLAPEDTDGKRMAMENRCNPIRFLADIFVHPDKVLDLMRCTGTIITGSRATEYFCRGACTRSSDVDFYCPSDIHTVAVFTYHLSVMGVKWSPMETSEAAFPDYFAMGFRLLKGTLEYKDRKIDIQCIWNIAQKRTATSSVLHFHSTLVQCFISGFAAVSLYDCYTSSKQAIHWAANDTNISRHQRHRRYQQAGVLTLEDDGEIAEFVPDESGFPESKILKKYRDRGFQFVEYLSQGERAHGNSSDIGCYGGRFRSVGDSGCRKVSFEAYLKHDLWDISFNAYYQALDYLSWYETEHRTTPIGGVLDVDFPYDRTPCSESDKGWSGSNQLFDPMSTSYRDDMIKNSKKTNTLLWGQSVQQINPTPWLGKDFQTTDFQKVHHACRYPC